MTDATNKVIEITLSNEKKAILERVKSLDGRMYVKVDHNGGTGYVLEDLIADDNRAAKSKLTSQGVRIFNAKDWTHIVSTVGHLDGFSQGQLIERPGWSGNCFAQANGHVIRPKRSQRATALFNPYPGSAACSGSYLTWRNQVASPLTGQTLPMIAILAGLAAPLLVFASEDLNFGFEFSGPPATGKSTCQMLMSSVCRDPRIMPSFSATQTAIEALFESHNYSPLVIDEANLWDGSSGDMQTLAFKLANGTEKRTFFRSDTPRYRFIFATSANNPYYESLPQGGNANAALQRLLPMPIDPVSQFGIFDFLPEGFASSGDLANHVTKIIQENYGRPMRRFLNQMTSDIGRDREAFQASVTERVQHFEKAVGVADTSAGQSRASSAFGLLYAAGCYAIRYGVLPSEWRCLNACIAGYNIYLAALPEQEPLLDRLLRVARFPNTLDLRGRELPSLTNAELEQHGAFLRIGTGRRIELLLLDRIKRTYFPDWSQIAKSAEFKEMNLRGQSHATKQRQVRTQEARERFYTFVLPAEPIIGS